MRNAELVADRLVVQSGSNHSGHRAADLAPWHSSVVQMSASPRVIWPRAWPDWSLHSARSTARCLSGVSGAGREPDAARETDGWRPPARAIKMKIKMKFRAMGFQSVLQTAISFSMAHGACRSVGAILAARHLATRQLRGLRGSPTATPGTRAPARAKGARRQPTATAGAARRAWRGAASGLPRQGAPGAARALASTRLWCGCGRRS